MFKFIHTADIHLDSALHGLERYDGAPVDEIRSATRRAFDNLIELAIDEEVDFVLLAGDIYDGDWKDCDSKRFIIPVLLKIPVCKKCQTQFVFDAAKTPDMGSI